MENLVSQAVARLEQQEADRPMREEHEALLRRIATGAPASENVIPNGDDVKVKSTERRRRLSKDLLDTTSLPWSQVDFPDDNADLTTPRSATHAQDPYPVCCQFGAGVQIQPSRASPEIQIVRQGLTDADADAIVALIGEGHAKKLHLAYNSLGPAAAAKLAACLESNTTLTWLSLHGNCIGDAGGMALARFLRASASNPTLKSLYLSANELSGSTKEALLNANEAREGSKLNGLNGLVL